MVNLIPSRNSLNSLKRNGRLISKGQQPLNHFWTRKISIRHKTHHTIAVFDFLRQRPNGLAQIEKLKKETIPNSFSTISSKKGKFCASISTPDKNKCELSKQREFLKILKVEETMFSGGGTGLGGLPSLDALGNNSEDDPGGPSFGLPRSGHTNSILLC